MRTIPLKEAVSLIPDGASVMIGGFMGVGTPERLVDELVRQGRRNLTVIANDNALPGIGIGKLVAAGAMKKTITSYIGLNPDTQKKMLSGELDVELVPQGTLIERIRAGGFRPGRRADAHWGGDRGRERKQRIEVEGKPYLLETALRADFALVQAFLADYVGNLYYALCARFNPVIAMAADTVIVEAEHRAHRRDRPTRGNAGAGRRLRGEPMSAMDPQTVIARRIARELRDGMLVNLGIGIPTLVANFVPPAIRVFFSPKTG